MSTILDYIKKEYERIMQEQKERKPAYRFIDGDNKLIIDLTQEWRKLNTRFGERVLIPAYTPDKKEYVIMISPRGKLYGQLIRKLYDYVEKNKSKEIYMIPVNIVRTRVDNRPMYDVEIIETDSNEGKGRRVKK